MLFIKLCCVLSYSVKVHKFVQKGTFLQGTMMLGTSKSCFIFLFISILSCIKRFYAIRFVKERIIL